MKFISLTAAFILLYGLVIGILLSPPVLQLTHMTAQLIQPSSYGSLETEDALWSAYRIVLMRWDEGTPFSPSEVSHLQDVQVILGIFGSVVVVCFGGVIAFGKVYRQSIAELRWDLVFWSWLTLSIFCLVTFPAFFESFHQLFFPNGNYSFPENSLLIQTFSLAFWVLEFVLLQGGVLVLLFLQAGSQSRRAEKEIF